VATAALYTPEVLGLATSLANFPWDETLSLRGQARSRSCGSSISLGLSTDIEGRIDKIGLKSQACAIGQAAAAIFAGAARGLDPAEIEAAAKDVEDWLSGKAGMPDWPGLEAIAPARDYPGRHGAILLAWQAARDILPSS
jgi:NifU-like protein involved in Fe-S cluster formation